MSKQFLSGYKTLKHNLQQIDNLFAMVIIKKDNKIIIKERVLWESRENNNDMRILIT